MKEPAGSIFVCPECGSVMELLDDNECRCDVMCCGKHARAEKEKIKGEGREKHIPVPVLADGAVRVRVGEELHPMDPGHYIKFIEVVTNDGIVLRRNFRPGEKPAAVFEVRLEDVVKTRQYCVKHGLWAWTQPAEKEV